MGHVLADDSVERGGNFEAGKKMKVEEVIWEVLGEVGWFAEVDCDGFPEATMDGGVWGEDGGNLPKNVFDFREAKMVHGD